MSGTIKTYTELTRLPTFQERFEYLKLDGSVVKSKCLYSNRTI